MRRLHLFEWEDQAWLPKTFRDFITDRLSDAAMAAEQLTAKRSLKGEAAGS